jgi:hypothetical protein
MIGASSDPLELEADRVANQVMAAPAQPVISASAPRIQRSSGQPGGHMDEAPASVSQALANSGQPLEPALRQDMEQRFGYDFSRVRVHFGGAAEKSALDVNAHAYTVGHDIVFGASRFAPKAHEGRRLIAHELTHVVQQSGMNGSRVCESHGRRGLLNLGTMSEVRVQRGPSDTKSPTADVPILGGSDSSTKVVVLYHYGNLEARRERDVKTEKGDPFESLPGYPRLTDCDAANCQTEVVRHTGTPVREKLRYKYELRIDGAYFEKNFRNMGSKGAYSEFGTTKPIPIRYFRIVSEIGPTSSAPSRLPTQSGEFTAKTPGPSPPVQRGGEIVKPGGSYHEVLSGEIVKGKIAGKGVSPKPTGGAMPGSTHTSGAGGGQSTPPTSPPAKSTTPSSARTAPDAKISPGAFPSSAGQNQESTTGAAGGALAMIHQGQIQNLQATEQAKAEKALKEIEPMIEDLVTRGHWVVVRFHFDAPRAPSITSFVFKELSDINRFVMITYTHGDTKAEALREPQAIVKEAQGPPEHYEAPKTPLGADRTTFVADEKIYPPQYNPKAIKGPYDMWDLIKFTAGKTYVDSKNKRSLYIRWEGASPILSMFDMEIQKDLFFWSARLDVKKQMIHASYINYFTGETFNTQLIITPENLGELIKRVGPAGTKDEVAIWKQVLIN